MVGHRRFRFGGVVAGILALLLAPPTLARSAADPEESLKDRLPKFAFRLVGAPAWSVSQNLRGERFAEADMAPGFGVLGALGGGDKQKWHYELEVGFRNAEPDEDESAVVRSLDTYTVTGNGYFGFKITEKVNGYLGAGLGLASHRSESDDHDLALLLQGMVGGTYELTENLAGRLGLRYFATERAYLGEGSVSYRRPELELGMDLEF